MPTTAIPFSTATHNGCVTMVNPQTGNHRTIRIKTQDEDAKFAPGRRIISLLTGSNNERDYTGFGFVNADGTIDVWRKKQDGVFPKLADMIVRHEFYAENHGIEYVVEGRCRICNRLLTDEQSIAEGIGPTCKKRL